MSAVGSSRSGVMSAVGSSEVNSRGDYVNLQDQPYTYISIIKRDRPSESDRLGLKVTLKVSPSVQL